MKPNEVNDRALTALHKVLVERKLQKKDLAQTLGIKSNTLSEIMGRRMKPGLDVLAGLAQFYEVSPSWLLCGTGDVFGEPATPERTMEDRSHRELQLQNEINYLNRILEEKERTIQILMNQKTNLTP